MKDNRIPTKQDAIDAETSMMDNDIEIEDTSIDGGASDAETAYIMSGMEHDSATFNMQIPSSWISFCTRAPFIWPLLKL